MTKKTILVVDDEPNALFVTSQILKDQSYQVITAENGRDGVSMATENQPDLILMDIVMPDMHGFQAKRKISRATETKHIPVIIVSSKDQETDKVWGERQGAKGYITKPVDKDKLVELISQLL